jgi:uncharacterized protein (TIGR02145 family)
MVKYNYFYLIFICLIGLTSYCQKVSNITFMQEQSKIVVSYDLETKTPCKVSLYVSTNGGATWQGPLKKVTGNVGYKVVSGKKNIVWNVLEEFEDLKGDNIKFQVKASGEYIETVVIGNQEWTKRNLNVSRYRNGDIIPEVKDKNEWANLTTGAWCYYNNDPKNGIIYGKLYNWYAVNDSRGLAPEGFHIPSEDEFRILENFLGGILIAGGKMKEKGMSHWSCPNKVDIESSNFRALPGGARWCGNENWVGKFHGIRSEGFWWLVPENDRITANNFNIRNYMSYLYSTINSISDNKASGLSVRCIKD